jgi:hypothetical protein
MYHDTLRLAREADWPWEADATRPFPGDHLIGIAAGCLRAEWCATAPHTPEDAAILQRRAPSAMIDEYGRCRVLAVAPDRDAARCAARRYLNSLNK